MVTTGGAARLLRPPPDRAPAAPVRLTRAGRARRLVVLAVLGAGCLAGSLVGDDHWWPLGPWRMYSTSSAPTGEVRVFALQATTAPAPAAAASAGGDVAWRDTSLGLANAGLNRAELEGRAELVTSDPAVLGTLAQAHARLHPDDAPWTGVRLLRRATVLQDRRPTGEVREEVLAEWTADGGGRLVAQEEAP
ncbi:hypothetical protein [Quadrisphaera sp. DSM 44207]|uniref:hypothetical protein n=1 Tax=Quadrisphaera sp. DSM 44207 TaxID=1881057 RepID=UPI00088D85F7|nr:hypothetical protein [Quadrisphaera sp. DSM 44207]SDQ48522.1 hypothetical protein SAMN05428996_1887 [Quadrisphaera sp. DSM 44207]